MKGQLSLFELFSDTAVADIPESFEATPVAAAVIEVVRPVRTYFSINAQTLGGLVTDDQKIEANLLAAETLQRVRYDRNISNEDKTALARYTGWGGLSKVFKEANPYYGQPEHPAQARLKAILGEDAYNAAAESVLTAYYTAPHVVQSMWAMVRALGFKSGRVLEPSCATGMFIGAMPEDMRNESHIVGVEIDPTSAAIATALYGDEMTIIRNQGIETCGFQNEFDLVIGNVPFGNYKLHDERFNRYKLNIHDYFLIKSLDMVRAGGLVALITSSTTLDNPSKASFREQLEMLAEVKLCVRLPEGAFSQLGGTDVVADIIILQKRASPVTLEGGQHVIKTNEVVQVGYRSIPVNNYYKVNPSHLLGELAFGRNRWGENVTLKPADDWKERLASAADALSPSFEMDANVHEDRAGRRKIDPNRVKSFVAYGYFFSEDGQLMSIDERNTVSSTDHLPPMTVMRITGMTRIRDLALKLLELDTAKSRSADHVRQELNAQYDDFVSKYGPIMSPVNRRLFRSDSHAPLLWSLEKWDEETEQALKAEIFERSTVSGPTLKNKADSLEEAIALSYNTKGHFCLKTVVGSLEGANYDEVVQKLVQDRRIFMCPKSGAWIDAMEYLSGHVRSKLKEAEAALKSDLRYETNVEALRQVIPVDVRIEDIQVRLGVPWIEARYVENWIRETFMVPSDYEGFISHHKETASWSIDACIAKNWLDSRSEWGTIRKPLNKLLEDLLHQKTPEVFDRIETVHGEKMVINRDETIAAQERADKIQKSFSQWLMNDEARKNELQETYNHLFNGVVNRQYDGSHLIVPGLNPAIALRQAQKDSIWRGIVSGNTLYALAVGGGKTLIQICLAQESKRLGLANKPVLVVPNHMLEAFASEYLRAFPKARVLAASKDDMQGQARGSLLMKMALNDWDAVIMTHSTFGKIHVGDERVKSMIRDAKAQAAAAVIGVSDKNLVREAQRSAKMVESKLLGLMTGDRDKGLPAFDQMGIDMILVDEADLFKNLFFFTRKKRIPGINSAVSQRALDLFIKSRVVFDQRRDSKRGLVFSTATPISNTIGEMFIMQKYLQEERLAELGIDNFDTWSANFAREVTCVEVKPEGSGYRLHTRFAQFVNVPELMLIFKEVAEIRTKKQLDLPEPSLYGGAHEVISMPASDDQKSYVESLVDRAQAIRDGEVKPDVDNMLCVTNDGRKAALDMRCVNPLLSNDSSNKVNACIEKTFELWRQHAEQKATQLIFCDMSVPGSAFSVYEFIRDELVSKGVPAEQIAFAQDYNTDAKKAKLHSMVRAGKIRVLIGSTELMGFGTNVQDRLIAEHHLDAPWRPRDVEQRDGRIIRQGNMFEVVHIYRYVTAGTFDAYMWQGLERKSRFISQVMENDGLMRNIEDVSTQALSYAEVKALAGGNPLVIEKAGADAEVARLSALLNVYKGDMSVFQSRLRYAENDLEYSRGRLNNIEALEKALDASIAHPDKACPEIMVNGRVGHDLEAAAKAITKRYTLARELKPVSMTNGRVEEALFAVKDVQITYSKSYLQAGTIIGFKGEPIHSGFAVDVPYGAENLKSYLAAQGWIKDVKSEKEKIEASISKAEKNIQDLTEKLQKPFEFEQELDQALARKKSIDDQLEIDVDDKSAVALAQDD